MHPDECVHGNTHIEDVNECVICQRDRFLRERDETQRKLKLARDEVEHLQRDVSIQRDWKWKAESEAQRLEREVASLQAENEKLRSEAWAATSWASGHNCGEENRILYERAGQMEAERDAAQKELNELLDALVMGPLEAGTMQDTIIALRKGIDEALARVKELERSCPCTQVTPCHDRCSCVIHFSSSGCRRCSKYGSAAQRQSAAARIAGAVTVYEAAIAWEADKGTESSWNRPNGSDERLRQAVRQAVESQRGNRE